MAYITTAQLSARLGATIYARLTDRVSGTTASSTVAQQIVDEAEAEANSYLAVRYRTPVDLTSHPEVAAVLAGRVLDLAECAAWRGSPFVSDPPQRVKAMYETALNWFVALAAGSVVLPASSPPATQAARATNETVRQTAAPRVFTAAELDGL
jgi:phage gp36-like protein